MIAKIHSRPGLNFEEADFEIDPGEKGWIRFRAVNTRTKYVEDDLRILMTEAEFEKLRAEVERFVSTLAQSKDGP